MLGLSPWEMTFLVGTLAILFATRCVPELLDRRRDRDERRH